MRTLSQLLKRADAGRKPIAAPAQSERALSAAELDQVAAAGGKLGIGTDGSTAG